MDEAGDPTPKYMLIRDAIKDYLPLPNISVPVRALKMTLPALRLQQKVSLLSPAARRKLGRTPIKSQFPLTFEKLDQYSGFVLYEATLPKLKFDPTIFAIPKLNDRAHVLIDDVSISKTEMNLLKFQFLSTFPKNVFMKILLKKKSYLVKISFLLLDGGRCFVQRKSRECGCIECRLFGQNCTGAG